MGKVTKIDVLLLQEARSKTGGDRYEAKDGWTVYIPQWISRPDGGLIAISDMTVTFEAKE